MYPKYFGLKEPSFSIAPDPHYLFLSEQHKEALAHLLYGVGESGGFVLLTGEVGTGKTTVCRAFLEQLPAGVDVALILNPAVTGNELLLNLCDEFRIPVPEGERSIKSLIDRLNAFLLDAHGRGRRPVLIIDEAQNLRPKVLEQVRLLTNLETTKHKLLQIFLIGQPELRRMLERDALRQINQRITARFHLRPFKLAETRDYIRHRVAVAGVDRPLFTAAAIRLIHQRAGGVPRLVNILCDRALLGACVTRASQVTPAIVKTAAREVQGESIDAPPRPAIRPAFGVAAALMLMMVAGWLGYSALSGHSPRALLDTLPAERWAAAAGWLGAVTDRGDAEPQTGIAPTGGPEAAEVAQAAPESESAPDGESDVEDLGPADVELASDAGDAASESARIAAGDRAPEDTPILEVTSALSAANPASAGEQDDETEQERPSSPAPSEMDPAEAAVIIDRAARSEAEALPTLLGRWGLQEVTLPSPDPCAGLPALGLRCERGQGTLGDLRRADRPALLRLANTAEDARFVVLGALDASTATLDWEDQSQRIPLTALEARMSGDYLLVWRPLANGVPLIGPGAAGDMVLRLRELLAQVPGAEITVPGSPLYDRGLRLAIEAFQSAHGLAADGIVGPRTMIQLNNVTARSGIPRLSQPAEPEPLDALGDPPSDPSELPERERANAEDAAPATSRADGLGTLNSTTPNPQNRSRAPNHPETIHSTAALKESPSA
ncbi:peptidoglycan-binding protein [Thiocapsa imhoffii]|uniref:Peptidoglycan-binding protein n=2 Tax=Thiocapsa imhoffii TaxID=382777 RepID=A0A9X1B8D1_9GAMM|nr:peptidoglycan-binding protein [Thiocapsa imhoffii]